MAKRLSETSTMSPQRQVTDMGYIKPEFEIVSFETADVITASIAVSGGDNDASVPKNWWD